MSEELNQRAEYEDQAYVEGVRDLARMIAHDKTANWKAVSGVLCDCADMIEKLARTEAKDALGWQPIETAPEHGTLVLVCGRWENGTAWHNIGLCDDTIGVTGDWHYDTEPTHWLPLPTPPHTGGE